MAGVVTLGEAHHSKANPRQFMAADMSEPTLQDANSWYELFAIQGDTTTVFGAGYGRNHHNLNSDGWSDLDVQNGGGTAIEGRGRFRVYRDSSKDQLIAQSGTYTLSTLRNAVSAARKDKVLIYGQLSKMAGNDSFLTFEVQPAAASVGDTVSASNSSSDEGLAFSELMR